MSHHNQTKELITWFLNYFYHGEQHQYQTPKGDLIKENMLVLVQYRNWHNHDKYR
jgi:hypothetical protein